MLNEKQSVNFFSIAIKTRLESGKKFSHFDSPIYFLVFFEGSDYN